MAWYGIEYTKTQLPFAGPPTSAASLNPGWPKLPVRPGTHRHSSPERPCILLLPVNVCFVRLVLSREVPLALSQLTAAAGQRLLANAQLSQLPAQALKL